MVSFFITWTVGLIPPLTIRYLAYNRPLSRNHSIFLCTLFWIVNISFFTLMGSTNKSHTVLLLIAFVSHAIYTSGNKPNTVDNSSCVASNRNSGLSNNDSSLMNDYNIAKSEHIAITDKITNIYAHDNSIGNNYSIGYSKLLYVFITCLLCIFMYYLGGYSRTSHTTGNKDFLKLYKDQQEAIDTVRRFLNNESLHKHKPKPEVMAYIKKENDRIIDLFLSESSNYDSQHNLIWTKPEYHLYELFRFVDSIKEQIDYVRDDAPINVTLSHLVLLANRLYDSRFIVENIHALSKMKAITKNDAEWLLLNLQITLPRCGADILLMIVSPKLLNIN